MGQMIRAKCNCGFQTDVMYLGGGMMNHTVSCIFPNYCKDCKSLFEANMYDKKIICNKCGSTNTVPYNNSQVVKSLDDTVFDWSPVQMNEELKLSKNNSLCPQCNEFALEFIFVGMWD